VGTDLQHEQARAGRVPLRTEKAIAGVPRSRKRWG